MLLLFSAVLFVFPWRTFTQFPAICNIPNNLQTKTCCPNNCGGPTRGSCESVTERVVARWGKANSEVNAILEDAPNQPQKGTADARYLWPTVVFDKVCLCNGNFGGVDCSECDFGWTGRDCSKRKTPVIRKSFGRLTETEKQTVVNATRNLKKEMGYWSVIVEEPTNYTSGMVTLQNVSTYDFFIYLHSYAARGGAQICTRVVDNNITIDFAYSGPAFPMWHRRYLLTVEKEFQRITNDTSFALPYWQWEDGDLSPFTAEYYGIPSNNYGSDAVNVSGQLLSPDDWNTLCDITYWSPSLNCSEYWRPCNPANDLAAQRPLQRGGGSSYLPNRVEVMIAIAAPSYDAADAQGNFFRDAPRQSFRSRLEGWNIICSAVTCTGPRDTLSHHMHNSIRDWVGGQMSGNPAAANDPIFNFHHCNLDRILESWIQKFTGGNSNPALLPAYVPVSGGHPGHNRDDYMVPFFPLITAGGQYRSAVDWGYQYDELIIADIQDNNIPDCSSVTASCPICDANSTCINCTSETCPSPVSVSGSAHVGLGLGLGLGLPLLIAIAALVILIILLIIFCRKRSQYPWPKDEGEVEVTSVQT